MAHYLARAVRILRAEDKTEIRLDRERLFEAILERDTHREALVKAVQLD